MIKTTNGLPRPRAEDIVCDDSEEDTKVTTAGDTGNEILISLIRE